MPAAPCPPHRTFPSPRITRAGLTFNPMCPVGISAVCVSGISYQGSRLDFSLSVGFVTVEVTAQAGPWAPSEPGRSPRAPRPSIWSCFCWRARARLRGRGPSGLLQPSQARRGSTRLPPRDQCQRQGEPGSPRLPATGPIHPPASLSGSPYLSPPAHCVRPLQHTISLAPPRSNSSNGQPRLGVRTVHNCNHLCHHPDTAPSSMYP